MIKWLAELKKMATRRHFPNLLYAEKWIKTLQNAGMYPRWRGDNRGE